MQEFNVSTSRNTVAQRIQDLSADLKHQASDEARAFEFYLIACDESTEATLIIFLQKLTITFDNNSVPRRSSLVTWWTLLWRLSTYFELEGSITENFRLSWNQCWIQRLNLPISKEQFVPQLYTHESLLCEAPSLWDTVRQLQCCTLPHTVWN